MSTAVSIRLPDEIARQLDSIAKETERPRSYIVQKALESYIEDYADLQIALDRLHDKTDPIISGKKLKKSLGL
ncbi:ribbon-helix-helix protein, CopG family [Nitrospira defluvii]|nr:ribbon-helix-helix protein, CopG family [Nitrospira defluvii]